MELIYTDQIIGVWASGTAFARFHCSKEEFKEFCDSMNWQCEAEGDILYVTGSDGDFNAVYRSDKAWFYSDIS